MSSLYGWENNGKPAHALLSILYIITVRFEGSCLNELLSKHHRKDVGLFSEPDILIALEGLHRSKLDAKLS